MSARPPVVAHVCDDIACKLSGADALCGDLEARLGAAGEGQRGVTWMRSP